MHESNIEKSHLRRATYDSTIISRANSMCEKIHGEWGIGQTRLGPMSFRLMCNVVIKWILLFVVRLDHNAVVFQLERGVAAIVVCDALSDKLRSLDT